MTFSVHVDARNPGQFFACCGLFELATRLSGTATARFADNEFIVDAACTLTELLGRWTTTPLVQLDPKDDTASPIRFAAPFDLLLDWWRDDESGGKRLKVWAGSMQNTRILRAMMSAFQHSDRHTDDLFNRGCVVVGADGKKVEPFYFDARRAPNAHSRDVGFSPNDLELTTTAFPAVEALCLIGLQRFRPMPVEDRHFEYSTWSTAIPASLAAAVACGVVEIATTHRYRFENLSRTKYQKAFRLAVSLAKEGE